MVGNTPGHRNLLLWLETLPDIGTCSITVVIIFLVLRPGGGLMPGLCDAWIV